MPKTLTISDEAYNIIKQSAEINGRSLIKELDILLRQPVRQDWADTVMPVAPVAPAPKATPVAEVKPVVATTPSFPNGIDWEKIESEVLNPDAQKKFQKQLKEAKKKELERGAVVGDLTEKDLATAKVTFEERPDFKEPEEWDKHAWPTV